MCKVNSSLYYVQKASATGRQDASGQTHWIPNTDVYVTEGQLVIKVELAGMRREGISGVVLQEVGGGWQLRTDPGSAEFVKRYLKVKPQRLTRAGCLLRERSDRWLLTRAAIDILGRPDSFKLIDTLPA